MTLIHPSIPDKVIFPVIYFAFLYFLQKLVYSIKSSYKTATLLREFTCSFCTTSGILIRGDWYKYFGFWSVPLGTIFQSVFCGLTYRGSGNPISYYHDFVLKNGSQSWRKLADLAPVVMAQCAGSCFGYLVVLMIWSHGLIRGHTGSFDQKWLNPGTSIKSHPIQAMVMESTCFVVLIVCERLAVTKFNFSKTRFLMPWNASVLSCLVVWCYKETGAMINPALALSMNIFVWHKEPFTHFLVYWIFPWSVVHMVSLYQVGRSGTVGHKKMVARVKKEKQGRGKL